MSGVLSKGWNLPKGKGFGHSQQAHSPAVDPSLDPRVPTWDGAGGAVGLELYELRAKGYVVGLEENKRALAGP